MPPKKSYSSAASSTPKNLPTAANPALVTESSPFVTATPPFVTSNNAGPRRDLGKKVDNVEKEQVEKMINFLADDTVEEMTEQGEDDVTVHFKKFLTKSSWKPISDKFVPLKMRMEQKGQSTNETVYMVDKKSGFTVPLGVVNVDTTTPSLINSPFMQIIEKDAEAFCTMTEIEKTPELSREFNKRQLRNFVSNCYVSDGEHCKYALHRAGLTWTIRQKFCNVFNSLFTFAMMNLWMNGKYRVNDKVDDDDQRRLSNTLDGRNFWRSNEEMTDEKVYQLLKDEGMTGMYREFGTLMGTHMARYAHHEMKGESAFCATMFMLVPSIEVIRYMTSHYQYFPTSHTKLATFLTDVYVSANKNCRARDSAFFDNNAKFHVVKQYEGTPMLDVVLTVNNIHSIPGRKDVKRVEISLLIFETLWQTIFDAVNVMGWIPFENYWNACEKQLFIVEAASILKPGIKHHILCHDMNLADFVQVALQNLAPAMTKIDEEGELITEEGDRKREKGGVLDGGEEMYMSSTLDMADEKKRNLATAPEALHHSVLLEKGNF